MAELKKLFICVLLIFMAISPFSCGKEEEKLIIFHAGSLSVPFSRIASRFEEENPGVEVQLEAAGSRRCARKISELGRECDVIASADYEVINQLLMPEFADWNIRFASNEMVIAYMKGSRGAQELTERNWYRVLRREDVSFGRSDPDADPCGYRTVLTIKLAGWYYEEDRLAETLLQKDTEFIRSKETDLLGLLEAGALDFIFIYRSVARQHGLGILTLPDHINLKNPEFADYYGSVSVRISGKKPGEFMERAGAPMVYGVTVPKNAPSPELAVRFVEFLLEEEKGLRIMEENGQPPIVPAPTATYGAVPEELKRFASKGI
jgi:molybdate/tungstate transport system substrate-binding protein